MDALAGFTEAAFTHDGETHPVFRTGSGPAVLVMTEIPGITPLVADFARRVAAIGCTAVMPSLFGTPGREPTLGYGLRSMAKTCVSKEFTAWARNEASPVTNWAKALARHEHEECGGPGVGVVGMCMTGNFALAMMVDPVVCAPVLSQPSLPIGFTAAHRRDLKVSSEDLAAVKKRCAEEPDLCVLGLRFTNDTLVPEARFERLREELGDSFIGVEIDSSKNNPHGLGRTSHSVLTEHLVDEPGHPTRDALDQVLQMFRDRLLLDR